MERKELTGITAKTLYSITASLATHVRKANVINKIRSDIFSVPLAVHADETPWPILNNHDNDVYDY